MACGCRVAVSESFKKEGATQIRRYFKYFERTVGNHWVFGRLRCYAAWYCEVAAVESVCLGEIHLAVADVEMALEVTCIADKHAYILMTEVVFAEDKEPITAEVTVKSASYLFYLTGYDTFERLCQTPVFVLYVTDMQII